MRKTSLVFSIFFILITTIIFAQGETLMPPFHRGAGQFVYTDYMPLKDKPVTVFFYIPTKGDITKMRVLISMHGDGRGRDTRDMWQDLAEANGFIVIAPEFLEQYYNYADYLVG